MVDKLLAQVTQERLQHVAEDILLELQCGFMRGRSCCNMIFVAQQMLQKALEHQELLFIIIVDKRKVFDSVPRFSLW